MNLTYYLRDFPDRIKLVLFKIDFNLNWKEFDAKYYEWQKNLECFPHFMGLFHQRAQT
jgi:hypothetical protein